MATEPKLHFFTCSVTEDLFGVSPAADGGLLPTPGGGKWLPVNDLADLGAAVGGFDETAARCDIERWECHWFTSRGPREIKWGPDGPPDEMAARPVDATG